MNGEQVKVIVCTQIQFIFIAYIGAELTRILSTYDAFYLVFYSYLFLQARQEMLI